LVATLNAWVIIYEVNRLRDAPLQEQMEVAENEDVQTKERKVVQKLYSYRCWMEIA
jgi:hypothetical protein